MCLTLTWIGDWKRWWLWKELIWWKWGEAWWRWWKARVVDLRWWKASWQRKAGRWWKAIVLTWWLWAGKGGRAKTKLLIWKALWAARKAWLTALLTWLHLLWLWQTHCEKKKEKKDDLFIVFQKIYVSWSIKFCYTKFLLNKKKKKSNKKISIKIF